ncbi:MAG: helix-turn-helix domain-containing protein [Candidatus Rokubacteria bacterium]|nr:helix-turn-helix domain-containing protein [Candidatus Rokubacteria bacterium]
MLASEQSFGQRLRALRGERGWSQAELAARLGVSIATLSRWEHGWSSPGPRRRRELRALFAQGSPDPSGRRRTPARVVAAARRIARALEEIARAARNAAG